MAKSSSSPASFCRLALLLLIGALSFLCTSCSSFNGNMGSIPDRSGAPPYPDDPEANGNPAKAWYN